jgi:hypothetical protein
MTERKPPATSWESWVEQQIREARERGAFDDLPGAGKPIAGLDKPYDPLWWVKSWLEREKLSALPPDLELRKRIERELASIWRLADESQVRLRVEKLNRDIAKLNASGGTSSLTSLVAIDVDEVVEKWRRGGDAAD